MSNGTQGDKKGVPWIEKELRALDSDMEVEAFISAVASLQRMSGESEDDHSMDSARALEVTPGFMYLLRLRGPVSKACSLINYTLIFNRKRGTGEAAKAPRKNPELF